MLKESTMPAAAKQAQGTKGTKESRESREIKKVNQSKAVKEIKESSQTKAFKEVKEPDQTKAAKEIKEPRDNSVQSIDRALDIIEVLSENQEGLASRRSPIGSVSIKVLPTASSPPWRPAAISTRQTKAATRSGSS